MKFSKNVNNKKCAPKLIFFNEKKIEKDSDNFWHRKLTLKVRNWQFSITWFRAGVDLPENLFYEKLLFFTQLSYHLMCRLLKKSYMLSSTYVLYIYTIYVPDKSSGSKEWCDAICLAKYDFLYRAITFCCTTY